MDVLIISSSRNQIDDYYKSVARSVAHYLAINGCNLIFGGSSSSMMGICYEEFKNENRNIYTYTTLKYADDLQNLASTKQIMCETTFDLKKKMFENSDLIVCLPGGIGTISELLSYIEEKRSNDKNTPIIIYDEDGYYKKLFNMLDKTILDGFSDKNIYDNLLIAKNREDLENLFIEMRGKIK